MKFIIRKRWLAKINSQLLDMLTFVASGLKAGLSLPQVLEMASVELPDPLGFELKKVVHQIKLGVSVDGALAQFESEIPIEDIALFVHSICVQRRAGGNLVETLDRLTQTIEGRQRVADRVRVLTAQGVYQGALLLAMPWILGAALYAISPEYIEPLISTRLGAVFIFGGIIFEVMGGVWLKKIVMIRV